jgi:ATP-dependent DNA ligase
MQLPVPRVVLDGEIVIEREGELSFDDLLLRVHPAESRIRKLAGETPASYFVFDLLAVGGEDLTREPLAVRRARLEELVREQGWPASFKLSPATTRAEIAQQWFDEFARLGLEGIMAKKADAPYRSGSRDAMLKIKRLRTADCVVGGVRYQEARRDRIGALLLGLYDTGGLLHHVGMCSSIREQERTRLAQLIEPLKGGTGFTGKAPGGPSRWSHGRSMDYMPLGPELVCEVRYDYFNQGRFRHGTKLLRWRPEKDPRACTFSQVE